MPPSASFPRPRRVPELPLPLITPPPRHAVRALLFVLLVAAPVEGAAPGPPVVRIALAPVLVPAGDLAFSVLVEISAPAGAAVEIKAWLGDAVSPASRTWSGTAWASSVRYVATARADADGVARAWLALKPEPGSRLDALALAGEADVGVRARLPGGAAGPIAQARVTLAPLEGVLLASPGDAPAVALGEAARPLVLVPSAGSPLAGVALVPDLGRREAWRLDETGRPGEPAPVDPPPALRFTEALPRSPGRGEPFEYVAFENARPDFAASLAGTCLEAGRNRACFDGGRVEPGASFATARDPLSLLDAGGPAAVPYPGTFTVPDSGTARITWLGRVLDEWDYGSPGTGVVVSRDGAAQRLGTTTFEVTAFEDAWVTPLLAPDHLLAAFDTVAAASRNRLDVAVYSLQTEDAAAILADAALRGVKVRLLVEGGPVGGLPPESRALLDAVALAGVDVRVMDASAGLGRRYDFMHAKYVIADGATSLVLTENFSPGSYAPGGAGSTRGYGLRLDDDAFAAALHAVFEADANLSRPDVRAWPPSPAARLPMRATAPAPPLTPTAVMARVTLATAPDGVLDPAGPLNVIAAARDELRVAALYFDPTWKDRPSPYAEALFAAAARGVRVQVLLAASDRNAEAVEYFNARARATELPLEARLYDVEGLARLHGKALFADAERAWVGSLNFGEASATRNREVGLVVESPAALTTWWLSFEEDWNGGPEPWPDDGVWEVRVPWTTSVLVAAVIVASGVIERAWRRSVQETT